MRILIVEDETFLAEALEQILKRNRYLVDVVNDGLTGLEYSLSNIYDVIILDIMLPKLDGLKVLREIRKENIKTPVILLTARSEIENKVEGLDMGADDYLTKPFATEELLARVRALARRKEEVYLTNIIEYGDFILDKDGLLISCGEKSVKLTLKESELIELLVMRKKMISSKEFIIEKLWGYDSEAEHNHVEVYISFLRKKLKYIDSNVYIDTIRGVGYKIEGELNV